MGFFGKVARIGARVGTAFATGGGSEVYRAVKGKPDPVTQLGEDKLGHVGDKLDNSGSGPAPGAETPEQKAARQQREAAAAGDLDAARKYHDNLVNQPEEFYRPPPVVTAPGPITPAAAGAPNTVTSSYDPTMANDERAQAQAHADYLKAVMMGTAGPSAAELAMRRGNAEAIAAQSALAAQHHGYSSAGLRAASRNVASLDQQNIAQTGELRAQEQAQARGEYQNLLMGTRGQDITQAGAAGAQALDAAKANQAAKLQTDITNAGFSQAAILQMSDQELRAKLANAGFQISQEQIDDLRSYQHQQQIIQTQGQILDASGAASRTDTQAGISRAEIQQRYDEAKAKGDAADEAFYAKLLVGA